MFAKQNVMGGTLVCDGNCAKAWGIQGRPRIYFQTEEKDPDDYVYLPDSALPAAPLPSKTVGLSEGGHIKPSETGITDAGQMNKWCSRQCERSTVIDPGQNVVVPDLEHPLPNRHDRWLPAERPNRHD